MAENQTNGFSEGSETENNEQLVEEVRVSETEVSQEKGNNGLSDLPKTPKKNRKSKGIAFVPFLVCIVLAILLTAAVCSYVFYNNTRRAIHDAVEREQSAYVQLKEKVEKFEKLYEVADLVDKKAVNSIDGESLDDILATAYISMLDDRYAAYYTKEQMQEITNDYQGDYVGLGIRTSALKDGSGLYVVAIFDGSHIGELGIKVGDIIVAIEGERFTAEKYNDVIALIGDTAGEYTNITVASAESNYTEEKVYSVELRESKEESVSYKLLDDGTAFIRIVSFEQHTPDFFRKAMEQSEKDGAERYIFDVRNNPGGGLDSVVKVLDMLLPEGTIMTYQEANGEKITLTSTADEYLKKPAAVLINDSTASAAELFSAALRDYDLATLVGVKSYGKGTMQTRYTLSDGSGIKCTTAMYYPPCGINYDGVGLEPDPGFECELPEDKAPLIYILTPEEDDQLQVALKAFE